MFRILVMISSVLCALVVSSGCRSQAEHKTSGPTSDKMPVESSQADPKPNEASKPLMGTITLAQTAQAALLENPELKVFPYELRVAQARAIQAGLLPNPKVGVEVEGFAGSGERTGFDAAETTVTLGQLIELGGKRAKRMKLASFESELAELAYESKRLDVLGEVTTGFFSVLAAQERLALSEQLRDLSRDAQSTVAQRVEAGKDSPVEDLRAGVAYSRSRIELSRATRGLAVARQQLAATWGASTPIFEAVQGPFYQVVPIPMLADVNEALAANPDLARWSVRQQQRRAAMELEKARSVVDITVQGGVQRFQETDDSAFILGLSIPIPVFDRNQGGIAEATANLAKTHQEQRAAHLEAVTLLSRTLNELAGIYDEIQLLEDDVLPRAQQAYEAAAEGYRQGKFDYLHVLDAQRTLFETKGQFIDSIEAYHKARAAVERLIGRPIEVLHDDQKEVR